MLDLGGGNKAVIGTSSETFCSSMVLDDEWQSRHLFPRPTDGPPETWDNWFKCSTSFASRTFENGKCVRRKRFIGEPCVSDSPKFGQLVSAGTCAHGRTMARSFMDKINFWKPRAAATQNRYKLSCVSGRCVPTVVTIATNTCSCSWITTVQASHVMACSGIQSKCSGVCTRSLDGTSNFFCDTSAIPL